MIGMAWWTVGFVAVVGLIKLFESDSDPFATIVVAAGVATFARVALVALRPAPPTRRRR